MNRVWDITGRRYRGLHPTDFRILLTGEEPETGSESKASTRVRLTVKGAYTSKEMEQRIKAGESPAQVRAWLIQRYGDYISYDPPLGAATWPLWAAPVALLVIGIAIARSSFRRKR